jgi:hypothetical protein
MWTIHIGSVVKQCADFMGFFTAFESGRTDAAVRKASHQVWARIEWEWREPQHEDVNEIDKLATAANHDELSVFIGYSRKQHHEENLKRIERTWNKDKALIVFLVTYEFYHGRKFKTLQTLSSEEGRLKLVREQPAFPWQVPDTTWALIESRIEVAGPQTL